MFFEVGIVKEVTKVRPYLGKSCYMQINGNDELVMTGLEALWPEDTSKAYYLGPWCFANNPFVEFSQKHNFNMIPTPWTNENFTTYFHYLIDLQQRIILAFRLHSIEKGLHLKEDYWRALLGPWLNGWIGQCADNYERLIAADNLGRNFNIKIPKLGLWQTSRYLDFTALVGTHDYQSHLFTSILHACKWQRLNLVKSDNTVQNIDNSCKLPDNGVKKTVIDYLCCIMSSAAGVPGTSASSNCKLKRAAVYVLRRPERSAAYQVVRENLETWPASQQLHWPRATKPLWRRAQGPGSGLGLSILQAICERYGTELKL